MPTSSTTHAPADRRALRPVALALVAGLAAGVALPSAAAEAAARRRAKQALPGDRYDRALLRELNRVRGHARLAPLRYDARLDRAAGVHSRAQARAGALAHGAWNGRVARAAGRAARVGEAIAWRPPGTPAGEARAVVRGWLASPAHRALVLDRGFRRAGLGRATGALTGVRAAFHTVDFATAR